MSEDRKYRCRGECDRLLDSDQFYPRARLKNGISTVCRDCIKAQYRKWYAANADRRKVTEKARRDRKRVEGGQR